MPFTSQSGGTTYEMQRARLQSEVELWRVHRNMDRRMLSRTLPELVSYCQQNLANDPLIFPVKENPFKEKKSCTIL